MGLTFFLAVLVVLMVAVMPAMATQATMKDGALAAKISVIVSNSYQT